MNAHVAIETAFRVDWATNVSAAAPEQAATQAWGLLADELCTESIFSVTNKQTGEVTTVDVGSVGGGKGTNFPAKAVAQTNHTRRTLRPDRTYVTRNGLPVHIMDWNAGGDWPLFVRVEEPEGYISGLRAKDGSHPQGGEHPLDVFEVNPTVTKWVRMYDRKLNEAGKQVVFGKEFAAERALNWYIYDTEAEARANMHGVRAVFPVEYQEGGGLA